MQHYYDSCGYVIDTHTAVAAYANLKNMENDRTKSVVVSTASPYKFTRYVLSSIDPSLVSDDDLEMASTLYDISKVEIPKAISLLKDAKVIHDRVCETSEMPDMVREFIRN